MSEDINALFAAVCDIACGGEPPVAYEQDPHTGDFAPIGQVGWEAAGAACAEGRGPPS